MSCLGCARTPRHAPRTGRRRARAGSWALICRLTCALLLRPTEPGLQADSSAARLRCAETPHRPSPSRMPAASGERDPEFPSVPSGSVLGNMLVVMVGVPTRGPGNWPLCWARHHVITSSRHQSRSNGSAAAIGNEATTTPNAVSSCRSPPRTRRDSDERGITAPTTAKIAAQGRDQKVQPSGAAAKHLHASCIPPINRHLCGGGRVGAAC